MRETWPVLDITQYGDVVDSITFGDNGFYYFDLTSIVNEWIAGTKPNNGIALMTTSEGFISEDAVGYVTLAGIDGSPGYGAPNGAAPVNITTIPEPVSLSILAIGGLCVLRKCRY